jgi:Flp pilus assembly secretin CpaC
LPRFPPGIAFAAVLATASAAAADEPRGRTGTGVSFHAAAATPETLDLRPGFTKIVRAARAAHTIALGNPSVAEATVATPYAIAVTGKSIGTTNMVLLDEAGTEISETTIQVAEEAVAQPNSGDERREIRVLTFGSGSGDHRSRTYLCGTGCRIVPADRP